tara:strand:+ start:4189 stop:5244 length:1056 start_codon:yes stop_codon:yes gene_type:complete
VKLDPKFIVFGLTVLVAAASGELVQHSDRYFGGSNQSTATAQKVAYAPAPRFDLENMIALSAPIEESAAGDDPQAGIVLPFAPLAAGEARLYSPGAIEVSRRLAPLDMNFHSPNRVGADLNQYGLPCEPKLSVSVAEAAMVVLSLVAPCRPDERVEISHGLLQFAMRTTNTGVVNARIPALARVAAVVVRFEDGKILTGTATVPDADEYERVALLRYGQGAMQIHALEFGAGYGDAGHVWAGAPRTPSYGAEGRGGFLVELGDLSLPASRTAEVYSYPEGQGHDSGIVRVSIEAEVTEANCGQELFAETLQPGVDEQLQVADLALTMPDCSAVGEFLVLKNILRDLKIARN